MHINLELLETVYLTAAMLLEVSRLIMSSVLAHSLCLNVYMRLGEPHVRPLLPSITGLAISFLRGCLLPGSWRIPPPPQVPNMAALGPLESCMRLISVLMCLISCPPHILKSPYRCPTLLRWARWNPASASSPSP